MGRISGRIRAAGNISGNIRETAGINGQIARPKTVYVKELHFANHYEFPAVGEGDKLYIARDEHMSYYFDEDSMMYVAVGLQLEDIEIVNGGNANAK